MILDRRALMLTGASLTLPAFARAASVADRQRVLLISIDGLRPADVIARRGTQALPFLHDLMRTGSYATGVTGVTPTSTYPSHMTLLTGLLPARHGIVANMSFDPFYRNQDGWYWYYSDVTAPTLWSAARAAGLKTLNLEWPVSVGAPVDLNLPQIWRAGTPDDRKLFAALATSGLVARAEALTQLAYPIGTDLDAVTADERRAQIAARLIATERPAFTTLYFSSLDHEQHKYGPATPEAYAVLARLDAAAGAVAAAALRLDPTTLVAVVSDHGFARVTHDINLYRPLEEAALITRDAGGQVSAWDAMPWLMGGSAAIVLRHRTDAALRARVGTVLNAAMQRADSGIARIVGRAELDRLGAVPTADFLVVLGDGCKTAWVSTAPYRAPSDDHGMHGYLPDDPAMAASLFVTGHGVEAGRDLGTVPMTAIAGSLAARLGLALAPSSERLLV